MNAIEETVTSNTRPIGTGPGERLQAARIQQGLSIEDIAQRMHLSTSILEAIEENNYDEITAPIFVKGYLRAYARIVLLDEEEMIQQYVNYYSGEDPPIMSTSNMTPELSVTDARIKWTTYLVILVLAALLGVWWWNKEKSDDAPISLDTQSAVEQQARAESTDSEIEAASESPADASQGSQQAVTETDTSESTVAAGVESAPVAGDGSGQADADESGEIDAPESVNVAGAESVQTDPGQTSAAESVQEAEIETAQATAAESTETLDPTVGSGAGETLDAGQVPAEESESIEVADDEARSEPDNSPAMIAPSGSDRLLIVVIADTWADVKDGTNYQMVYDLLRAGDSVKLTGAAPFSVFLGNGHGVEIMFNDEDVDFTSDIRDNNTTRLSIGK